MDRNIKIFFATSAFYWLLVLLLATGEVIQAVPTSLVSDAVLVKKTTGFVPDEPDIEKVLSVSRLSYFLIVPVFIGGFAFALLTWVRRPTSQVMEPAKTLAIQDCPHQPYSSSKQVVFIVLRVFRGGLLMVAGWQAFGLLPALGWLGNVSDVTGQMLAIVVIKSAVLFACIFGAQLAKWAINRLHVKWFGVQHPALAKARLAL